MSKRSLTEQLNDRIDAMLARPGVLAPVEDGGIRALLRVAADLRDLPRSGFKEDLKARLIGQRSVSMNTATEEKKTTRARGVRQGFHTITPYVIVQDAPGLIEFTKQVFGAEELFRAVGGAGGIHCEVRIGDSMMMLGGGFEGSHFQGPYMPTALHIFPGDADSFYKKALQAGATSIAPPTDQPYGERSASVSDPFGNRWYIARQTAPEPLPAEMRTVTTCFHPRGAGRLVEFLERAFGAAVLARYEEPSGTIIQAKVRIGDSLVEIGEAHGPYQPMPTAIYMYVENVDAVYQQAMATGAKSIWAPANQPYGDRVGGVEDAFGNYWYISTQAGTE